MQGKRRLIIGASVLALAMVGATYLVVAAQEGEDRLAVSNGKGTLRVGDQTFKINSVVVKLTHERKAEITMVSDITIFLIASWSNHGASEKEFDLEIKGPESRVGIDGNGKVILGNDGKSVARLRLKGVSRTTQRQIEANFEGK